MCDVGGSYVGSCLNPKPGYFSRTARIRKGDEWTCWGTDVERRALDIEFTGTGG